MSLTGLRRVGKARKWNQQRGVVDPKAIERYLAAPNKDHEYVKDMMRGSLLREMPRFKMWTKPRLHQLQMWYLTTYYRSFLLYTPMGCIAGDAEIVVQRNGATRRMTLRDLHRKFHTPHHLRNKTPWRCRSLKGDVFGHHEIVDVMSRGRKPVIRITLADGKQLVCTRDHNLAQPDEKWIEAGQLVVGDNLLTNGVETKASIVRCVDCGEPRIIYPTMRVAKKPRCRSCYLKFAPRGPAHSCWKGGRLIDKDGYVRITMPDHPRANAGGQVYEHIVIMEKELGRSIGTDEEVHHRNGCRHDNRPRNLEVLTHKEHMSRHNFYQHLDGGSTINGGKVVVIPKITSVTKIEEAGVTDVYDIEMADPWDNFVANGVVVHNSGKTKVILDTIRFRRQFHGLKGTIVFTLNLMSAKTWMDECELHAPDLTCEILQGTRLERIEQLEKSTSDVVITNYNSLPMLLCDPEATDHKKSKSYKWVYKAKYLKRCKRFQAMVIDEIHMLGGYLGLWWRIADHLGQHTRYRYALTGTPFSKDPLPVYSQFKIIDHGETFGNKVEWFRMAFYDWKQGHFGGQYVFNQEMTPALNRMVRNRAINFRMEEFTDLPPVTFQTIECVQTPAMRAKYTELVAKILRTHDQERLESAFVNIRQCTSGYQTVVAGSDDREERQLQLLDLAPKRVKSYVEFSHNPKLEALMGLLNGLPEDEKVLIFCEYRHTVEMLAETLTKSKIKHVTLYGGTKDKVASLDKFYKDMTVRCAVANNVTASMGINPQHVCRYGVFFENSVRPNVRVQAEHRLHRPGQERPVFMYDIVIANSVDQKIAMWIRQGKNLLHEVLTDGAQRDLF